MTFLQDNLDKPVVDLYFTEIEMMGWQWHQLNHIQIICTLLQTDNLLAPHHSVFTGQMLFLLPSIKALKALLTQYLLPALMTQSLSPFLKTCPYHLSLFLCTAPL